MTGAYSEEDIELYLAGQLDPRANQEFEAAMLSNPDLVAEVDLHRTMARALRNYDNDKIKRNLELLREEAQSVEAAPLPRESSRRLLYYAAAAAIVMLAGLGYWFAIQQTQVKTNELFAHHFEAYPSLHSQRSNAVDSIVIDELAFEHYENGRYLEAARTFRRLAEERPITPRERFYFANALLASGAAAKAEELFENLLSDADGIPFFEHSQWFLALSILKKGDPASAYNVFARIAVSHSVYADRAADIARTLEGISR